MEKLKIFFEPLIFKYRIKKELNKEVNKYLANDFNFIELISPDENKISDLIALLLNPNGSHGQGKKFLYEFVGLLNEKGLNLRIENFNEIKIKREKVTTTLERDRRIDITIEFDNKFCIGIENKPWAGEQENQLIDYKNELEKHFSNNYLFIYLDGFGRQPQTIGNQKDNFLSVSYNNFLKEWLLRCYKECEAEKIRWFLKDFITWIEKNFIDMENHNV